MKSTAILTATLGLALGSLHAQTVPLFINYQGKVTDSAGVGLGTGTPVNRKVIFRIFDAASAGNRLWSEQHTVTISNGEFSVLLGNGIDANYAGVNETPLKTATPLDTVFTSAGILRYVEIVVDNGDNTLNATDAPIAPRQQITSTAYSFRARSADTITSGTDLQLNNSTNYGLGYYGSTRPFNGNAVDGPVLFGQSGGALGSVNGLTKNIALQWNAAGQIGVGGATTFDTNNKLTLQGDDSASPARQLVIRGNTDTTKRLNIGFDTTGNQATLQSYTAASTAGPLLLNPSGGNVGVGTNIPGNRLTVQRTIGSSDASAQQHNLQVQIQNGIGAKSMGIGVMDDGKGVLQVKEQSVGYYDLLLNPSGGNVGIATLSAATRLAVNGAIGASGGGYGPTYGFVFNGDNDSGLFALDANSVSLMKDAKGIQVNNNGYILMDGNVGIGATLPRAKLEVAGAIVTQSNATLAGRGLGGGEMALVGSTGSPFSGKTIFGTDNSGWKYSIASKSGSAAEVDRLVVTDAGNVGIGTTTPGVPLEVASYAANYYVAGTFGVLNNTTTLSAGANQNQNISIKASQTVLAASFDAVSDVRIKDVLRLSNSKEDAEILCKIEVTDYQMKDRIANGNKRFKKVIAQQVEKVYPQAVSQSTGVVPDIYQQAATKDGWVELATDLKVGERVKLIGENTQAVHEVLEVRSGAFRTDLKDAGDKLFVYGREVKDFRTVDYEAIAMLNVSATQQIKKEKDAEALSLREEILQLRTRVAALEAKDKARDAKMASIEKLLESKDQPATRTVSLKQGE